MRKGPKRGGRGDRKVEARGPQDHVQDQPYIMLHQEEEVQIFPEDSKENYYGEDERGAVPLAYHRMPIK